MCQWLLYWWMVRISNVNSEKKTMHKLIFYLQKSTRFRTKRYRRLGSPKCSCCYWQHMFYVWRVSLCSIFSFLRGLPSVCHFVPFLLVTALSCPLIYCFRLPFLIYYNFCDYSIPLNFLCFRSKLFTNNQLLQSDLNPPLQPLKHSQID